MSFSKSGIIVLSSMLVGCAGLPDNVELGYYLAQSSFELTVTQTASCTSNGLPILASAANVTSKSFKDPRSFHTLNISNLDGSFSNGDVTMEFYNDGRLKGINSTSKGQGSEIIKGEMSITQSLFSIMLDPSLTTTELAEKEATEEEKKEAEKEAIKRACDTKKTIGKQKHLTIIQKAQIKFNNGSRTGGVTLKREGLSDEVFSKVTPIFGMPPVYDFSTTQQNSVCGFACGKPSNDVELLELRFGAIVALNVNFGDKHSGKQEFTLNVPQLGEPYWVPIPKARMFGSNRFELALNEGGQVTKIKYGKDSGTAAAFGSATSALSEF